MSREVVLVVPDRTPPGLNGPGGLKRMHWTDYRKLRDLWTQEITAAAAKANATPPGEPVEITYMRSYKSRPLDWDNMGASFKPVGDALENTGIISNDSPDVITHLELRQFQQSRKLTRVILRTVQ